MTITLRMTEQERNFFYSKCLLSKSKNQTDFFLSVLEKKPIIVITNLKEILSEFKRHGSNLNQIARALNEFGALNDDFEKVINDCWNAYEEIKNLKEVVLNAIV